jgi:TetR/AcrR family transcriptional repressor of mexJK operon
VSRSEQATVCKAGTAPAGSSAVAYPAKTSGAAKKGRRSAQQSAEMTQMIVAVAASLFLERGYEETSMDAIAVAAGVPRTTLYKRFREKREVAAAAIQAAVTKWSEATSIETDLVPGDIRERLRHHARLILTWSTKHEVQGIIALASSALTAPGRQFSLEKLFGYNEMLDFIANDIIKYGPASGIEAREPRRVAVALMSMCQGVLQLRPAGASPTEDEVHSEAAWIVHILVDGASAW